MSTPIIHVSLWGRTVGYLGYGVNDTIATFEFGPEFASMALELSPIVMKSNKLLHKFDTISFRTFHGLPGIFADSLPDKFGNQLIDLFFADKGKLPNDITALDRLAYIGKRSMGAFEYTPEQNPGIAMGGGALDIGHLCELANMVLSNKQQFANELANASSHNDALSIIQIGSSAGGARSKALVARDNMGSFYDGSVDSGSDKTYWLLKFDTNENSDRDRKDPKGMTKIEYIYSLIAKKCGITLPKTDYLMNGDDFLFMIERFDREIRDGKLRKKHYSSWAALQHFDRDTTGAYSYEQLILTMRELNLGHNEFVELYRRAVFNIIGRNQDDHAKNFGFQMDRNGAWSLSPAFDMTFSYDPLGKWTNTHQISLSGKRDQFERNDLLAFASKCSIPAKHANEIIEQSLEAFNSFTRLAIEHEVPNDLYKQVFASLRIKSL
ncbi:MAG: type II toxin-antitoxin system HipA family toxin [Sulfuricurvum sp.]|nr:type II toxin-antitoxin system HipA family toxin [Sulfuricurvum sp.]MDD5387534.1 type II toxin-antitoxin system HipA family toxin [Sulfuricurvum sp.]